MDRVNFTFSDLVAGYVKSFDATTDSYVVETPSGNEVSISIGANCYAELVRNLGEGWQDAGDMRAALQPGRFVFSYGVFYPEATLKFEAKHLIFLGRNLDEWRFEAQDWWVKQVRQICDFYLNAQFPDGHVDFSQYRTQLTVEGTKVGNALRQETDTISRMVYGFATAYLLTGEDKYLEGAEKGTEYLREHLRFIDHKEDIVYWYHAVDVKGGHERKIFASEFGDDYDGIPAYEQIYALAGPTQTYRITGDAAIRSDIEMTLNLFQKYYRDPEKGGYFSHIHPVTFDPRDESLGQNRAKKNWNSVGDHAPAYLINLVLATGSEKHAEMLIDTGDTITKYFQDYDNAPFVQEKFFEDWTHDKTWGWQQNRGVVGHNLKIAWNLMRIHSLAPKSEYVEFAKKIAEIMPGIGGDMQRCGWYDVMERELSEGQQFHRYAWHDRKAWWQQEQGILAYLILDGILDEPQYKKLARESVAFYNSFFLDHDSNGVYFNVLATGIPYLMGTERLKGSHSMSGYHSTELCYLSAVYSNLLVTKQPLDLHFKPKPGAFGDNVLRVSPDILPPGSIKIEEVWIDGSRWTDFDSEKLTVNLPKSDIDLRVRVRVAPAILADTFTAEAECEGDSATLTLFGELDRASLGELQHELAKITAAQPKKVVMDVTDLKSISSEGMRALVFAKQKLDIEVDVLVVGATGEVRQAFDDDELADRVTFADALPAKA